MLGTYELNNVYCRDSYKAIKEIPSKSIDLIYTDIPYLFTSGGGGASAIANRIQKICNSELAEIKNGINQKGELDLFNCEQLDLFKEE